MILKDEVQQLEVDRLEVTERPEPRSAIRLAKWNMGTVDALGNNSPCGFAGILRILGSVPWLSG
jgi:hypothetical protein